MSEKNTSSTKPARPAGGHGPGGHAGLVEKPKSFWKTAIRLMRYMSDRWVGLAVVMIFAIASVIFQIRTPKILGKATTELYKGIMKGPRNRRLVSVNPVTQSTLKKSVRLL